MLCDFFSEHVKEQDNAFRSAFNELARHDWVSKAITNLRSKGAETIAEGIRVGVNQAYKQLPDKFLQGLPKGEEWATSIAPQYKRQIEKPRGTKRVGQSTQTPTKKGKLETNVMSSSITTTLTNPHSLKEQTSKSSMIVSATKERTNKNIYPGTLNGLRWAKLLLLVRLPQSHTQE